MPKCSDVKNGHFVPRVYLRSFADNNQTVECLFKRSGQVHHITIDKICTKRYMYAKTSEDGEIDNSVEYMLSDFEGASLRNAIDEIKALPYNVFYGGYCTHVADVLKPKIIHIILVQLLRGLKLKDWVTDYADKLYHQKYDSEDRLLKAHNPRLYNYIKQRESSIINNTAPEIASKSISNNLKEDAIAKVLNSMTCTILHIEGSNEFVTGDDPVLVYGDSPDDVGLMRAPLIHNKTVVCYPISPKIAATFSWGHIFDKTCYGDGIIKLDNNDTEMIKRLNLGQYNQSSNCIIAKGRNILETLMSSL